MSLRIITVDPLVDSHWEYAKRNGFWEMVNRSYQLSVDDDVVFMTTGQDSHALGAAIIDSEVFDRPADDPHRWSPDDSRRGKYRYRVKLRAFRNLVPVRISFRELRTTGIGGRLSSITAVPEAGRSRLEELLQDTLEQTPAGDESDGPERDRSADLFDPIVPIEMGDQRERVPASVVIRRGQGKFRRELLAAYEGRCAVTGSTVAAVLEAAHIRRYQGAHTDVVSNGLLLRSDIHTLFDCHRLTISPDLVVHVAHDALRSPYAEFDGQPLKFLPASLGDHPAAELLAEHNEECEWFSHGLASWTPKK